MPALPADTFDARIEAVLDSGAAVFSFTFGLLPAEAVTAAKARGMLVVGTATTVEEAVLLERSGCDAVVAQGSEAGAHRGTFASPFEAAMVGTIALVPQAVDAVGIPVIASGGIMDGRGLAAALALGACAVQAGTAFLTCDEAGIPDSYKQAILTARAEQTRLTRAFSGRPARGIVNRFMETVEPGGADRRDPALPAPEYVDPRHAQRSQQAGSRRIPLALGRPGGEPRPPRTGGGVGRAFRARGGGSDRGLGRRGMTGRRSALRSRSPMLAR